MISTQLFKKIKPLIFLAIFLPSLFWCYQFINGSLGVNPIEKLMDNMGKMSLRLIVLTLFISSLSEFKKFRSLIDVRRMIGLFAFFYVSCHFLTYIALDHFFDMTFIISDIIKRPFITFGFVSFILIGIALVTIVYWTKVIKNMVLTQKPKFKAREQESKNWVYDLIKGDNETVFVAEVPGPEDKIAVRLIDGILYIRGSQGFSKEVQIEGPKEMEIGDFKYRNGVLTLRIKTSEAL